MQFPIKWLLCFGLWTLLSVAQADQGKLPDELLTNAELYAKMDMIEQLIILENISEKDIITAQALKSADLEKTEKTP